MLVLDDCALALRDTPLSDVPVLNGEHLDSGMSLVEVDKPNDIEILIKLLKTLFEAWDL